MPVIDYVSQSPSSVRVTFADMPVGTDVAFVNTTSGQQSASGSGAIASGGSGPADIPIPAGLFGQYYLLAHKVDQRIAQTVPFYLAGPQSFFARLLSFLGLGPRA